MRAEDVEIFGAEQVGVAHLDAVLPARGKLPQKAVERCDEVAQAREVGGVEGGEFEDEDACFFAVGRERSEKRTASNCR